MSLNPRFFELEIQEQLQARMVPRSISASERHQPLEMPGHLSFSAVWQMILGGEPAVVRILWSEGRAEAYSNEIRSLGAEKGRPVRILDVCPFYDRGKLFAFASAVVQAEDARDFDYRVDEVTAASLDQHLQRLRRSDRIATRLHHFSRGKRSFFLVVSRRTREGETWIWLSSVNREIFAEVASEMRGNGLSPLFLDVIPSDNATGIYFCGFVSSWDIRFV